MGTFTESKDTAAPFQKLYDDEVTRLRDLVERGKLFVTLVTAYFAFFAFSLEKLALTAPLFLLVAGAAVSLVAALACAVQALRVMSYRGQPDPLEEIAGWDARPVSDAEFWQNRIVAFALAARENAELNNQRGGWLRQAAHWLLAGVVLHGMAVLLALAGRLPA
ncbi:hypothetical protein [Falsiroseomonas oryzae]|uniref:hypothetical protein n=1 Tax=Falsiroseomonas oryzae TaxID=2766473 RepID=UPI0022EAD55F|nr:hypothetical protein [Roseomonas sp. MO-31]